MPTMKTDLIVIGAGCAGMVAALGAQGEGAKVVLIDRGPIGIGNNSALSGGAFAGPTLHYDTEEYVKETLKTGKGINRELSVRLIASEAPRAFSFLRSLGLDLVESSGRYAVRSPRPNVIPGVTLVRALAGKIESSSGIKELTGVYVTEILKDGEKVCGVRGFERTGEEVCINAPAVVLATGGAGAIYLRSDNQKGIMGQGYYLAAKAGLQLWDMEFVQFFPLVIAEPGLPSQLIFSPHPKEMRLINAIGEDIFTKHGMDLKEAIKTKRDEFSTILFKENSTGPIYMDYRRVRDSVWEKHPLSILKRIKFDFRSKPLAVSPAAHFFMGGVRTDESAQTSLAGLFACGEVVWGVHGANRMAGNALTECVIFGRIAGCSAAQYARRRHSAVSNAKGLSRDMLHQRFSTRKELKGIQKRIREAAWRYAGVVRSESGLSEGFAMVKALEIELEGVRPQTVADRKLKEDLMSAAFVLKAVLTASISRGESRGAFKREDFPQQDDFNWRKNSCLDYDREKNLFSANYYPCREKRRSGLFS